MKENYKIEHFKGFNNADCIAVGNYKQYNIYTEVPTYYDQVYKKSNYIVGVWRIKNAD